MQRSESITNLVTALVAARQKFDKIIKDRTAEVKSEKGAYRYKYADLASVLDATVDHLSANGLMLSQPTGTDGNGRHFVETTLMHKSGEFMSSSMMLPPLGDRATPQQLGSMVSYIRRYAACAMLGIASEFDDDDGAAAEKKSTKKDGPAPVNAITTEQQQQLFNAAKRAGIENKRVQEILWEVAAVTKSKDLPAEKFDAVIKAIGGANAN